MAHLLIELLILEGGLLLSGIAVFALHGSWLWWYRHRTKEDLAAARQALTSSLQLSYVAPEILRLPAALSPRLATRLLTEIAQSLDGVGRRQLTLVARELGVIRNVQKKAESRFWWRRLEAARVLTLFAVDDAVMLRLLRDRHPLVRAQAAEWAANSPTLAVIEALLELLADAERVSRFTVQDTLVRMGRSAVEPLGAYIGSHEGPGVVAGLLVASGLGDARLLPAALARCRDAEPDVRAVAARVVGRLGGHDSAEALIGLLADPAPEVRSQAAAGLGRIGHWPAGPLLVPLLRDSHWIVRREAGMALRALGAPGILLLRRSLTDRDRFAADMARQVLDLPERYEQAMVI